MKPLFDAIIEHVPPPAGEFDKPVQILITNIDYDEYIGRIGIGRVERGSVRSGQWLVSCTADKIIEPVKMSKLFQFDGLRRVEVSEARLGDIVAISGISNVKIGETVCDVNAPEPLYFLNLDEPTITMNFRVNDSPRG